MKNREAGEIQAPCFYDGGDTGRCADQLWALKCIPEMSRMVRVLFSGIDPTASRFSMPRKKVARILTDSIIYVFRTLMSKVDGLVKVPDAVK